MSNKLQQYFPMIRTQNEILEKINSDPALFDTFRQWEPEHQQEFLDFCSGAKGVKMLYDGFSKSILNPYVFPERLNELLSLLLKTEVTIIGVLPNDDTRIADESSLVIMDILVQLQDGSYANVEIQRVGYYFPGQRSACYSADLLLRQYLNVRRKKTEKTFSYHDIKNVYTIVLFEKSPKSFHSFPDQYIHFFEQKSDTGLKMDLLQKYVFVSLDIFLKNRHNKPIRNRLSAWLTFLASDDPEDIISIITGFPEFKSMYEQIYGICLNMEEVMSMFSEELRILDRNTVKYMIDDMQNELVELKGQVQETKQQLRESEQQLRESEQQLRDKEQQLQKSEQQIQESEQQLRESEQQLRESEQQLRDKEQQLQESEQQLQDALKTIAELKASK